MTTKYAERSMELARRSTTESTDGSSDPFLTEPSPAERCKKPQPSVVYGSTESHQFEQNESEVWWHHQLQR